MMDLAVSLGGIDIDYQGNRVLRGLDLDVRQGEFVVLLGPSGCGKSTLLGAIAGLVELAGGEIRLHGQDVAGLPPKDRGIGMVFQSYALYPTMTVRENLGFGLRCAGRPRAEITERIGEVAAILRLTDLLDRKPAALSGGQRQRVAIGRALARRARILLCDEPLSNLDAKLRAELRRELKQLHGRLGNTVVYVTHDQIEAMTLADRIAVMNGGVIEQFGTPDEVYETPASLFVAQFVGSPAANRIDGALEWHDGRARFLAADLTLDLAGYPFCDAAMRTGTASLVVRPEHLKIVATDAAPLAGPIEMVERTGADTYVSVRVGALSLQARAREGEAVSPVGARIGLMVATDKVSLFSQSDGRRI